MIALIYKDETGPVGMNWKWSLWDSPPPFPVDGLTYVRSNRRERGLAGTRRGARWAARKALRKAQSIEAGTAPGVSNIEYLK